MTEIRITFENCEEGFASRQIKSGTYVLMQGIDSFQISSPRTNREISCEEAGCDGCQAIHRKIEGPCHLVLEATGPRAPEWKVPE